MARDEQVAARLDPQKAIQGGCPLGNKALCQDIAVFLRERTARRAWSSFDQLCPLAHGLATREEVRRINYLGTASSFGHSCDVAARSLGASPTAIVKFITAWDEHSLTRERLIAELEQLWAERLADAQAVQEILGADLQGACLGAKSNG